MISEKEKQEYFSTAIWTSVIGLNALMNCVYQRNRFRREKCTD
jgi:hypothetical protein